MTRSKLHHRLAAALGFGATGTDAESLAALRDDLSVEAGPRALTIDQVESVLDADQSEQRDVTPSAGLADLGVVELAERLVQALRRRGAQLDTETRPAPAMVDPVAEVDDPDEEDFAFAPAAGAAKPAPVSLVPTASPVSDAAPTEPLVIFPSQMVSAATRPPAFGSAAFAAHRPTPGSAAATEALEAILKRLLHANVHD